MKKPLLIAILTLPMLLAGCSHPAPVYYPPPPSYSQIAQQGFHDGYNAARRDYRHGAPPNPERHPRFRRPPVPPPAARDYRQGFREGYNDFFRRVAPPPA